MTGDTARLRPGQPAVFRDDLVRLDHRLAVPRVAVVVHRKVPPVGEAHHRLGRGVPPIPRRAFHLVGEDGLERRPRLAFILGDRQFHRRVRDEQDQAIDALGVGHAVDRRRVVVAEEALRHGQAVGPGEPAVVAALQHRIGTAVTVGVAHENGLAVFEQHRVRLTQVLACDLVHDDAALLLLGQVVLRDRDFRREAPRHRVQLFDLESHAQDVGHLALDPVAVRGRDDRAIRQEFHGRVRAVGPLVIVLETHAILSFAPGEDVVVRAHPADPVALRGALVRAVAEADEQAPVRGVDALVTIARQRAGKLPGLRPRPALIFGEDHVRVAPAGVLAEQHGDLLAVGASHESRFAQVHVGASEDRLRLRPRQPAVRGERLEQRERAHLLALGGEEPPVVVEHHHVVAVGQADQVAHDDDAAPVADFLQLTPRLAVVFRDGQPRRVQTGEHDQPLDAFLVDDRVDRGHFHRRRPGRRRRQAVGPRQPGVGAALHHNCPAPVTFGVHHDHRLVVVQQDGRGMAEVLALLAIDDDLPVRLIVEIKNGNRVSARHCLLRLAGLADVADDREFLNLHRAARRVEEDLPEPLARLRRRQDESPVDQEAHLRAQADHVEVDPRPALEDVRAGLELLLPLEDLPVQEDPLLGALEPEVVAVHREGGRTSLLLQHPQARGDVEVALEDLAIRYQRIPLPAALHIPILLHPRVPRVPRRNHLPSVDNHHALRIPRLRFRELFDRTRIRPIPHDHLRPRINLVDREPHAQNVGLLPLRPMPVRRRDDRPIGRHFHRRIRTVAAARVVLQPHAVLPLPPSRDVVIRPDPRHPVALGGALVGAVAEADHEAPVRSVDRLVTVARQRTGKLPRIRPRPPLVVREDHVRVAHAEVLAQQHRKLLAVRAADETRLARSDLAANESPLRLRPREPTVLRDRLVDGADARAGAFVADVPPVVVADGQVIAVSQTGQVAHRDDAPPFTDGLKFAPGPAVVFRDGHADRVESGE